MTFSKPSLPKSYPPRVPRRHGVDAAQADLQARIHRLASKVTRLEQRIEALHRSASWRASAPLRWLARTLKGQGATEPLPEEGDRSYAEWIRRYDADRADGPRDSCCARIAARADRPALSLLLWLDLEDVPLLAATLDSLPAQGYDRWDMTIAAAPALFQRIEGMLPPATTQPGRIRLLRPEGSAPATRALAMGQALREASGDWLLLVEAGAQLRPNALCHIATEIADHADARIIYADHDVLDSQGRRQAPCLKPAWNPDLFHCQNLVEPLVAVNKSLLVDIGGFREEFAQAASYDVVLRGSEQCQPTQIRRIPGILCHASVVSAASAAARDAAEALALGDHLARTGSAAQVLQTDAGRRVQYRLPDEPPLVSLIIPTRNALGLLRQCIESIVQLTTYPNYEILLVDNGSDEPAALAYLEELAAQPGFTVIRDDRPFNYSALNNLAARRARGSVLGLVNNDIELITAGWLEEMVSLALQPGIGAVGAKLLYPDGTLQHGGIVLGIGGIAGHANRFLPAHRGGYMNRALAVQSFSAVTGACLVVRKALYDEVGGLDEVDFAIAYNDVDFCLRLGQAGHRTVWTPHAALFHHESASRGSDMAPERRQRFEQEQGRMRARWGASIADDPAYNPNLTLSAEDFGLAWPPRVPSVVAGARS